MVNRRTNVPIIKEELVVFWDVLCCKQTDPDFAAHMPAGGFLGYEPVALAIT